mmetsp:Transcript_14785/g.17327  ORF Transcript_14785/g.17327 Transcript_14785/m.17327 type:complete len:470 (+) Transcript_14785:675-2084(+)
MTFAIAYPFFKNLSRTFLYGRRIHASAFQAQASAGAAAAVAAAPLPNIEIERPRAPSMQPISIDDKIRFVDTISSRRTNFGLPGASYHDPVFHECDMRSLWYKEWIFVGHDCELKKPGDWFTLQLGVYPILVTMGKDRVIRAFHNVCRHRGYPLCIDSSGSAKRRFKCQYHQWTYDLDGKLAFARDFDSELDKDAFSLKPIALESTGGYLFVSVSENPKPFQPLRDICESYLTPFDLKNAKVAHTSKIIEKGNWKMVWENNRECYHCKGSHPELTVSFPDGVWWNGMGGTEEQKKMVKEFNDKCEELGLRSGFDASEDASYRLQRIPLENGARSFTMDGEPAVKTKRLGILPLDEPVGDVLFYHYPSTWNHFLADHALSFRLLPISPTETEVTTKWLVPGDAVEGVDYDLETLTKVWIETNMQDQKLVEANQIGVSSPAYEPGPYNMSHESGVSQFVDWYCNTSVQQLN